jgi:Na+-transporting methylmalonyl-CoA/oxaloacetate decarboxylase gamma subunit
MESMNILKIGLTVVGILLFLLGLLWASQGSGILPYPETSPMINQSPWILRGATLAIVGIGMVWVSRRLR